MPNIEQEPEGKVVVFTDLDGTMMDKDSHGFGTVMPVLTQARDEKLPIVFVTSKTFSEIKQLQQEINVWQKEPFITENGHGVYIPKGYFNTPLTSEVPGMEVGEHEGFDAIQSSASAEQAQKLLHSVAEEVGVPIESFTEMGLQKFMEATGFKVPADAERALDRKFTEGFSILLPRDEKDQARELLTRSLKPYGFGITTGGLFESMMREGVSKGKGVDILTSFYKKQFKNLQTIGVGDGRNDIPFLRQCDEGFLVSNPHNVADVEDDERITKVTEVGPIGWNKIVSSFLRN